MQGRWVVIIVIEGILCFCVDVLTMHFKDSYDKIFYKYMLQENLASLNCSQNEVMVVCEGRTWCTITCWRQAANMISNTELFFYTFLCCESKMQKTQAPSISVIDNKSVKLIF